MSLRVTVVDEQTGDTETQHVPDGDYVIIVAEPASVHVQAYANGTHVLTVKGRRPGFGRDLPSGSQTPKGMVP